MRNTRASNASRMWQIHGCGQRLRRLPGHELLTLHRAVVIASATRQERTICHKGDELPGLQHLTQGVLIFYRVNMAVDICALQGAVAQTAIPNAREQLAQQRRGLPS